MSKNKPNKTLKYLGHFETLASLGFTPDDATFSPLNGGRLFISASADAGIGTRGVYEVTLSGKLIRSFTLPSDINLGFSIARVSSGPKVGHFFLVEYNGTPEVQVCEFDKEFNILHHFPVAGSVQPGDALAYNPMTKSLLVVDPGLTPSLCIEVTTSGEELHSFYGPNITGVTYNEQTSTYFGVNNPTMWEFSASGIIINTYDLSQFGVWGAVGIAYGQGKLFVADEGKNPPNSIGVIHVLEVSR